MPKTGGVPTDRGWPRGLAALPELNPGASGLSVLWFALQAFLPSHISRLPFFLGKLHLLGLGSC